MVQIAVNENSKAAKAFLEYIKALSFVQIVDENIPNAKTLNAMKRAKSGKSIKVSSVADLIKKLDE